MSIDRQWIYKMWWIYTVKYCSVLKGNEALIHVVTWIKLENTLIRETSQTHGVRCHLTAFR